jgi:polysaccharide chain length determinant protein (PEP-CTERM system associated)
MIRDGEFTVAEAKRILRHHWWIPVLSTVLCTALAIAAAVLLPKRYTSQTMVLVEQPTVPSEYVKPIITADLNHRLASMQEQILSRTRLEPIIKKFKLYPKDQERLSIDDLVERLRTAVTIKPMESMQGTQNSQLPGFYVTVDFNDPRLAQQICSEITSMFLEQNTREREQQASHTTSFLGQQLEDAKAKLDEQDAKLAEFKGQYLGALPDEEQTNLSLLQGMNSQLEANTQAVSRAQEDKVFNESLLDQQVANWKSAQKGQNPETGEQQLGLLEEQLAGLNARYTPDHPDVIKLQNQIAELKKKLSEAQKPDDPGNGTAQVAKTEPAQIQQLRAKIRQDELNISDLSHRQTQIQDQIRQLQGRLQASPIVEQKYKELTRNYQTALDFYNDLLKKSKNSEMATDLEHEQESEQFRVLDPPNLPDEPTFPKKSQFVGGGFVLGLALGLGVLYLIAYKDRSMHTERDVELCLKLPVLTLVPTLDAVGAFGDDRTLFVAGPRDTPNPIVDPARTDRYTLRQR